MIETDQKKYYFISGTIFSLTALILYIFGQPIIAASGKILFWASATVGSDTSQHISDWYSYSHFIHGVLFFWIISFFFKSWGVAQKFTLAMLVECAWEILENTPWVINRYREGALAAGYFGDSILNSCFDILFMCLGFWFANKFGWKIALVLIIFFELLTLYFIRDNLTLNIIQLLHPTEVISNWQVGS